MDSATAQQALDSFQPTDSANLLSQAQSKYGVQDLSTRVDALRGLTNNLTNSISAVDPSVTGRTSGSLVTEAQRSALVNRERQPLLTSLASGNQALSGATSDLNNGRSLATQLATSMANDQATKYSHLKDQYTMANTREQQAAQARAAEAQAQADAAKQAESVRQFNVGQANSMAKAGASAATDAAKGYKVSRLNNTDNYNFEGPNGTTNMYQYAAALNNGDANGTYSTIKQLLANGSETDKGAAAGITRLEKQGLSTSQIIARLKASNGYIFN